jgi:NAD(P)H-hydrate epimerase
MREVDRRTMELGIPGPILMENAGHRAVEFLLQQFGSVRNHRVVIFCGKGNNGGDGYVIARQLFTRYRLQGLHVVAADSAESSEPRRMLEATGCPVHDSITPEMRFATVLVDALLGTGVTGAARGRALELIREINTGFPNARVLAVDVPSGMNSDSGESAGEVARADATITFTAPKLCHVLSPNCEKTGAWRVAHIGSPASLMNNVNLHLSGPEYFRALLQPRQQESNKGTYGHVLVIGGAPGKTGAAEMTGLAALRSGAGLATVCGSMSGFAAPELMTMPQAARFDEIDALAERMNVLAIGPGLGTADPAPKLVLNAVERARQACVVDADGLNVLAGREWRAHGVRVLTPHPGEMARLSGTSVAEVQASRLDIARAYAASRNCILVLKGYRTAIALPDGRTWINPTGTPALATGGSGDILTGLIAGFLAQFPEQPVPAVLAAVYLHGLAAQRAAAHWGEKSMIATDLLNYLPGAIRECQTVPDEL